MTIPLGCSDCSPSCQPQKDNNILVICNRKYDTQKVNKIIKRECHFSASKMIIISKQNYRRKSSQTLIITKCKSISKVFVLLVINKRKTSLNSMYYENMYFHGLLGACFAILGAFLIHYQ